MFTERDHSKFTVAYYFPTDRAKCRCIFFILTEKSAVVYFFILTEKSAVKYFFILTEKSAVVYFFILTEKNTFSGRLLLLKNNDLNYFRNERLRDKGSDMLLFIATQNPVSFIPWIRPSLKLGLTRFRIKGLWKIHDICSNNPNIVNYIFRIYPRKPAKW